MKDFIRAMKLYLKNVIYLPTTALSAAVFFAYLKMIMNFKRNYLNDIEMKPQTLLILFSLYHIPVIAFFLQGAYKTSKNKFFLSTSYAKRYLAAVPVISALILSLVLDVIMNAVISVYAEELSLSTAIIINALATVIVCFITGALDKAELQPIALCAVPLFFMGGFSISKNIVIFTDIPVPAAIVLAVMIYAAGTALNILIMLLWWKFSGRSFAGGNISSIKRLFSFTDK